jgi:hypothetical protein
MANLSSCAKRSDHDDADRPPSRAVAGPDSGYRRASAGECPYP